jgi:hypothetical protein
MRNDPSQTADYDPSHHFGSFGRRLLARPCEPCARRRGQLLCGLLRGLRWRRLAGRPMEQPGHGQRQGVCSGRQLALRTRHHVCGLLRILVFWHELQPDHDRRLRYRRIASHRWDRPEPGRQAARHLICDAAGSRGQEQQGVGRAGHYRPRRAGRGNHAAKPRRSPCDRR